jgi:NAD dependent epimerase/dehydratase family enzyme
MGELADALLLKGQRVVPARAVEMGFEFRYRELEPALRKILGQT